MENGLLMRLLSWTCGQKISRFPRLRENAKLDAVSAVFHHVRLRLRQWMTCLIRSVILACVQKKNMEIQLPNYSSFALERRFLLLTALRGRQQLFKRKRILSLRGNPLELMPSSLCTGVNLLCAGEAFNSQRPLNYYNDSPK